MIATEPDSTIYPGQKKRPQLGQYRQESVDLRIVADGSVGD